MYIYICIYLVTYLIYFHFFAGLNILYIHRTTIAFCARRRKWEIRSTWQSWSITSVRPAWSEKTKMRWRCFLNTVVFFLCLNFGVYHGISRAFLCFFLGILSLSKTHFVWGFPKCAKLVTFGGDLPGVLNGMPWIWCSDNPMMWV